MSEKWREAFDQVRADEELKEHTRDYLQKRVYSKKRIGGIPVRAAVAAAACLVLVALASGGSYVFFTPTAYISIDINPSLELGINRFDRIVSVEGYSEEAKELLDELDIRFLPYQEGIQELLDSTGLQDYLAQDGLLSFTVAGDSDEQSSQILDHVETCARGHQNMQCYLSGMDEMEAAHQEGMSVGKYRAYLALRDVDPSVTLEEVRGMSMRQIQELLESYGVDPEAVQSEEDCENGQTEGSGQSGTEEDAGTDTEEDEGEHAGESEGNRYRHHGENEEEGGHGHQ